MKLQRDIWIISGLILFILLLFCGNVLFGEVSIEGQDVLKILQGLNVENSSWSYIIENRLNRSVVAIGGGGALAVAGLILQIFFRNPLAGPGVLGITSGASLGVALMILGGLGISTFTGSLGIILAGLIGALSVLFLLLFISKFIHNAITLLVAGLMFGYFTSAIINVLFLWANETNTRAYVIWGLGSFEGLTNDDVLIFMGVIILTFLFCFTLIKPLNALVLGIDYAKSLGVNIKKTKATIILVTGVFAAIVTVYCGPISFIGIAVPQLIRVMIRSKNHGLIIPVTFLAGGGLALLADFTVRLTSNSLPLNTVTALIGAPIIITVIVKMNRQNA